ncbi:MAG: NAD(P)H-binding protein [Myxococcota bacterium]
MSGDKPVVALAGATGFVGQALMRSLTGRYRVVGLTRSPTRSALPEERDIEWRHCDLFSIEQVETALEGVDYAIYLVHSMLPNARLTQATFEDLDLLLADNFARAAQSNRVKQIIYVGGINPRDNEISRHLESRLEVEATLGARGTPTTSLRAGLILGPGGSSMRMLVQLVRRLPVMILPRWTESRSAPIAIEDVVRAVERCLGAEETFGQHFELGGPDQMNYREMMERTAAALGIERPMIKTPVFSAGLSTKWVAAVTSTSEDLVGPLIESLAHSVLPEPNWLNDWLHETGPTPFDRALAASVDEDGRPADNPRRQLVRSDEAKIKRARTVRSVQRLSLPGGEDAQWAADEYLRWLPRFLWPLLDVKVIHEDVQFRVRGLGIVLLQLWHDRGASCKDRQLLLITGGVLAHVDEAYEGRLEFRQVLDGRTLIAAIHDFRPTLPWYLYNLSQAIVHLIVMTAFGRHLRRLRRPARLPSEAG